MEENSEVQMETDVSSTTVDMPDTMQVTGIHGNVKTTIVVEEIKEEDINSNISAEPSPTKSNEVQKVLISSKLPLEKGLPKEIIIHPIKEVQVTQKITPLNTHNSKEVNCTPTESETEQKTPTKTDYMQTTLTKSEQVQKTQPKLIQVLKAPAKFEHVQKIVSKSDQLQNTPNKELVKTAPKSEQLQIKASMTEQVPKKLEQMEEVLRVSETMLQQTSKKDQNSKTLPKLEQVHKTPVEQVNKKLDQFKKYLGLKSISISEQLQKAQTNSEQVKKTSAVLDLHNKSDQVKNTHELNSKSITPSNPSEQQTSKDAIHTTLNFTVVKSSDMPDTIVIDKSLKETKQPEESNEQQESPKESPRKPDPVNKSDHSSKSNKTSIKECIDQQTLNKDCFNSTDQTKESSDKLKGDKNNERKSVVNNTSIDIVEKSNDSQLEASSDLPEKDHNRSISRELKSLIKSAKESKIISECTQLTSKTRKSRAVADSSNTSLNVSVEADKIQNVRRSSINSQESNCSEKSERAPAKRSMRSQNPEFVNKVKLFLNSVTGKNQKGDDEDELDDSKKETLNESSSPLSKKKKLVDSQKQEAAEHTNRLRSDLYCWRCHWVAEQAVNEKGHPPLLCTVCPRSFHYKCLSSTERSKITNEKSWICPECLVVLHAESSETRSLAMKKISLGHLCELLQYALERMMDLNGVEPFILPVDRTAFPDYEKYVVHPMDLSLMKKNISEGLYGSTEAFLADSQWILHNSIIFNTCMMQSKLTAVARALVRSCRAEMGEIEACPECYSAAHARRPTWFTDVCSTPHMLLWAKLKGFPYWPAKGMSVNSQGLVDVRFFGAHDRAWVPARDCFLYCEKDPNNFKAKRQDILESMHEAEDHIRNISRKYGKFVYAAFKTHLDPTKLSEQLKMMIPSFDGEVRSQLKEKSSNASPKTVKDKGRSSSKSSKSSINESDVSENEDAKTILPRKMADGAEIAREQDYFATDKNSPMEVDEQNVSKKDEQNITKKEKSPSRKRRRSGLEEAVITIITTSSNEKRKRVEDERVKHDKQAESVEESTEKREENLLNSNKSDETAEKFMEDKEEFTIPVISKVEDKEVSVVNIDKTQTVPSMSIKSQPRGRPAKTSTPKDKEEKTISLKQKSIKSDKIEKDKQDATLKSHKRNSRTKSLSSSQVGKGDKNADKKNDKDIYTNTKDKVKDINISLKDKESVSEKPSEKANKTNNDGIDSVNPVKDQMQIDDNISLAVLARETANKNISGLPTITSVRSLSTTAQSTSTITNTTTITTTTPKTIETTIPTSSTSNVFTPLTSENVRNMKDAMEKLQKLRTETDKTLVGRVGVRSFARMTSPPAPPPESEKQNETVEVEVKSEPIDFDDADRQVEKMDLMKAFQLRPVNPVTMANLRDVRINKVVVAPPAQKAVTKTAEVKIRARKTFPQPRKDGNESRSELNGKNSMVYIPIQPPTTQAPTQRPTRPITINGNVNTQTVRPQAPTIIPNSVVNTQSTPLASLPVNTSLAVSTPKPTATFATNSHSSSISVPAAGQLPTIGHVPTTVHTVPLLTSVNGQWTFSLQPMMSVGGDGTGSPAVMNGLADRNQQFIPIAPANPLAMHSSQLLPNSNNNSCSNNSNCENTPVEMPRLQQRPPLVNPFDTSAPAGPVPVPSCAGPITAKLSQNAVKLADFFRNLLVDSLEVIDDPSAQAALLKVQLEQAKWKHQQEVNELKHTHELLTTEMRVAFEKEKARTVSELRRVAQAELEAAVKAAKTKQWCANCNQEAQFYCCWNTSYCDYSCQRSHWTQHFAVCTQQRNADNNANENGNLLDRRLQPGPENLPVLQKSSTAPTLAVGTKITPTRVYAQAQEGHPQKTSIIVSMVEDPSGNPMVKCVGTYKSPGTQQVSPLLLNKQLMNDENAAKKVMTTGGYLIVGAGNNTPLTTTRRNLPVQFTYNT